ncbi:hypothetical protein CVIC8964_1333 [Campylobacter vicugnae]|uniref:Uncharacterized protein n=1 Tax=Campylobacter vicugnae TaxID=1660076 RepID=A0A1X9T2I7_9BACT|nr:hypothetical protein [Campylobacter sp. RM8964]ARR02720.1 hypothetical protein CVIC8964_1333 [Campylobacter sp. RM8964]
MNITENEKRYLQMKYEAYQRVAQDMGNAFIQRLGDLFQAIQENRDLTPYVKRVINPFEEDELPTQKESEPVIEAKEVKPKAVKWTKVYEEALLHASKDSTSNKRRTLEYLEQTLPFSKAAIKRKAYRLGLKWKKGKLVDAKA